MLDIDFSRSKRAAFERPAVVDAAWAVFAAANLVAMALWPSGETIPFHLIWISLTLLYGFRVWRLGTTGGVLALVAGSTATLILLDALHGIQLWGELFEVPLMSAMFLAMVWHARRRHEAVAALEDKAGELQGLLDRQERFLHDASHELRTPVTIARGHLELAGRADVPRGPEIDVALDELGRIERIVERLLLLAKAEQRDFVVSAPVDAEAFIEDVFMRWSEVVERVWRLGPVARGIVGADREALRIALDALLENAVKYTEPGDEIELRSHARSDRLVIEVCDGGCGLPEEARARVFERFARADPARTRSGGGAGLGLAIVDAIVRAHGGSCSVRSDSGRTVFALLLPQLDAAPPDVPQARLPTDSQAVHTAV
jgi:signal transduction histidine kinase